MEAPRITIEETPFSTVVVEADSQDGFSCRIFFNGELGHDYVITEDNYTEELQMAVKFMRGEFEAIIDTTYIIQNSVDPLTPIDQFPEMREEAAT